LRISGTRIFRDFRVSGFQDFKVSRYSGIPGIQDSHQDLYISGFRYFENPRIEIDNSGYSEFIEILNSTIRV
jgi:hypothetical protein